MGSRSDPRRSAAARGYGGRWRKARRVFLDANPWCVMCLEAGLRRVAKVVDHRIPHKGDPALFWDEGNWQSLCATHHSSTKQRDEHGGTAAAIGVDGVPLNADHHWRTRNN